MAETQLYVGPLMVRGKSLGFFSIEGMEEDILIPTQSLSFALDGDIVQVELLPAVSGRRLDQ